MISKEEAFAVANLIQKTHDIEEMVWLVHAYEKLKDIAEGKEESAEEMPAEKPKSKGGRKPLDHQRILDLHDQGRTQRQIAELVGCVQGTVHRILRENGRLGDTEIDTGKVMALYHANWTLKDIAGEFGRSEQYIEDIIKELKDHEQGV